MERTFEEKLKLIKLILSGMPLKTVAKGNRMDHSTLRELLHRYHKYGEDGLRKKKPRSCSPDEKEKAVRMHLDKGTPLQSVCLEFDVSYSTLKKWVRKVRKEGYAALRAPDGRGRYVREPAAQQEEKKDELEMLRTENLRLRAENALLKKVRALVEGRKSRALRNGCAPSTN